MESIEIGIYKNGKVVAGLSACVTTFNILYVSSLFVEEEYHRQGYGSALLQEMERRAKLLGVNTIRLDTFHWQGKDFYLSQHYQQVGYYHHESEGYAEYFFVKHI